MTYPMLREAIDTLLGEIYEGPADPKQTWVASNVPDSGVLGTIQSLSAEQARSRPPGLAHGVAEHVAHLLFSIDVGLRYARGEPQTPDWSASWRLPEPFDDAAWLGLQRSLREAHLRMRMWVHADERFETQEAFNGFIASVAHASYHLGCIRQLTALVAPRRDA